MSGPVPSIRVLPDFPGVWRGHATARVTAVSTGRPLLDAALPGHGWPLGALTELMPFAEGIGELQLLFPALLRPSDDRPIFFIGPPHSLYGPALVNVGLPLSRIVCIDSQYDRELRWSAEQLLREGCAAAVLLWSTVDADIPLRRLQLAAEQGHSLAFLYRPAKYLRNASPAAVRLGLHPMNGGMRIEVVKARGGQSRRWLQIMDRAAA